MLVNCPRKFLYSDVGIRAFVAWGIVLGPVHKKWQSHLALVGRGGHFVRVQHEVADEKLQGFRRFGHPARAKLVEEIIRIDTPLEVIGRGHRRGEEAVFN